jgi:hypothetical protein
MAWLPLTGRSFGLEFLEALTADDTSLLTIPVRKNAPINNVMQKGSQKSGR